MPAQWDKILHFTVNFIAVLIFGLAGYLESGIALAIIGSVGKELYDDIKKAPTSFSVEDLIADFLGMGFGAAIVILSMELLA
ncbi:hypothetical protein KAU11_10200 [Candidatus Babeliales bacterium]|nr:hypothetical protein [Candidatus Babeliales bacterium]